MGREARANPRTAIKEQLSDGPQNQKPVRLLQRGINFDHPMIRKARLAGRPIAVTLGGTRYLVDERGQYRRAPLGPAEAQAAK